MKTAMEICDKIQEEGLKLWVKNLLYWYIKHARRNKCLWYLRSFAGIFSPAVTALIPVLSSANVIRHNSEIITALIGVASTIFISYLTFLNPEKKHLLYRKTAEDIKYILFANLADSHDEVDYENMKKEIEECVLNEQKVWWEIHKETKGKDEE